jgi:Bacteriophage tail sheath protein
MAQVNYPGVYIEEFTPGAPIEGVGTSTAGFVGVARKGPIDTPTLVQSWDAYVELFGGFLDEPPVGFLATAVYGFFLNGGTACYVLRIGTGKHASVPLTSRKSGGSPPPVLVATAVEEGPAGNQVTVEVLDASLVAALLKEAGSPDAVLKPVFASTTSTAPTVPETLPVGSVAGFALGDRVHLTKGPNNETAVIKSIDAAANTLTFATPLPSTVSATGTKVFIENLAKGRKRFRVVVPAKFVLSQALPTGATIHLKQVATEEIVVVESAGGDTITLKTGLANDYNQSASGSLPDVASLEFTLRFDDGATVEEFANLAVNPAHLSYWRTAVASRIVAVAAAEPPPVVDDLRPKVGVYALSGGVADDRTLAWNNFNTAPAASLDRFREIDEIAIVAAPGGVDPVVQQAVRDHCESTADRFGILDGVRDSTSGFVDLKLQFAQVRSARGYVALYYPWLTARNPLTGATESLPPSGHLAGVYARSDQQRGVHKAPANVNVRGALGLERRLTDEQQGPLNILGIDVLRVFPTDSQPIVWGARTTATDRNWQYVNIRRLFLYLEESIQEGIRWALFEPNNLQLWQKLNRTITEFLTRVWKDGALFGETPKEAFYVRIDEALNPPSERALGRLTIEIGVKPSYPAEFIIVRIGIWQGGAAVSEG